MSERDLSFSRQLKDYGRYPALVSRERTLTYIEYHRAVNSVLAGFSRQGVRAGHRVGLIADNSLEYVLSLMALVHIGAVACPISPRFPARTLLDILSDLECTSVVIDSDWAADTGAVRKLAMTGPDTELAQTDAPAPLDFDRPATIVLTSGTSARPKGVLLTYGNHYFNARGSNDNIPLSPGDRWLLSLPLYHVGGLGILFRCLLSGAAVVIPGKNEALIDSILAHNITHLSAVPTQLRRMLGDKKAADVFTRPRAVLVGGGPVPFALVQQALEMGFNLHTSYGCTEMASQVTTTAPGDPAEKLRTSGRPLKYGEIRIAGDGEICVRGRTRFRGYVGRDIDADPFDDAGWFGTGDVGSFDHDGYLTVF
ncbi:MAG: AMP-binding protein [Candidatus Zixiibacteriota bacterium]|nr:MAG: AMP-binding protein [candidate division Zixibacteria bacterium]